MPLSRRLCRPVHTLTVLSLVLLAASPVLAEGRRLSLREQESWILAITGKAGLLRFLGHRHAILAASSDSQICYDSQSAADSWADLSFSTAALDIDSDEALRRAELRRTVDPEERDQLQQKMQSSRFLAADEHPAITYRTTSVAEKDERHWLLTGDLTLRGTTRRVEVVVEIEPLRGGMLQFHGDLEITHRQFGMEPESIAGVVRVADKIDLELHIVAELDVAELDVGEERGVGEPEGRGCPIRSEEARRQ